MVARAPRKRLYRTMQGKMIDIEKLRGANENVQAVGNMNVNARGDILGAGGEIVKPKSDVIQKYYERPRGMVDDTPTRSAPKPVNKIAPVPKAPQPKAKARPAPRKTVAKKTVVKKGIDAALDGIE